MNHMLKKLQKMQKEMMQAQKELEESIFTGSAGGVVSVEVKGDKKIQSITIEPEVLDPDDVEILQDMILAAINQAMNDIDQTTEEVMAPYAQGLPGMPF